MPNSDRKIIRGVRTEGKTYTPGMEDELGEVLTSEAAKRLSAKGYLEGKWEGKAQPKPETKTDTKK